MSEEKTTHSFEAEVEQVLRLVINSLYSNREIFLRELLSNASDALDKLRFQAVTDGALSSEELEVRLIADPDAHTLTVWDNGIGMSREDLVANLGTIARSGSKQFLEKIEEAQKGDVSLIGQFGVGFYSAWLVADRVEVVSRAAGSEQAHRWHSEAKDSFTVESAEREVSGTSVVLHLGEAHRNYLDAVELRRLVERYSDYLSWPIKLARTETPEGEESPKTTFDPINRGSALWQRPRSEVKDEQYKELYRHVSGDFSEPLAWRHFKFEGSLEFAGVVFIPRQAMFNLYAPDTAHGVRLYVKRVFIMDEAEDLIPRWLRFVRGVVDSEDLSLNVSREILQDSRVVKTIQKQIVKQVLDALTELADENPEDYQSFWESFGPILKEGLDPAQGRRDRLAALLRFHSSADEGWVSLASYKERMKEGQEAIYYVVGESLKQAQSSPHIEAIKKRGYEVLYMVDPVDQFMEMRLTEFDGTKLISATDADLKLDGDTEDHKNEARETELKEVCERFQTALQEHVSEVRLSNRLTDSPACLVLPPGGLQPYIERMIRATQKGMPKQKRILEINPDHAVVENLRQRIENTPADAQIDDWMTLLFEQSLIAEGSPIDDPAGFNRRLTTLLSTVTVVA